MFRVPQRLFLLICFSCICIDADKSLAANNATFVSQNVPVRMTAGTTYSVSVTLQNTGDTTWTTANAYKLGSQNSQDNTTWGQNRVALPASIAPNAQAVFSFSVTAPSAVGAYNFQWRMVQDGVDWFGGLTSNSTIQVTSFESPIEPTAVNATSVTLQLPSLPAGANALNLQRASDSSTGTTAPPSQGMAVWLKADAIAGLTDGARVSRWSDASGQQNHAMQSTLDRQPLWISNALNGKPIVRFDGVGSDGNGDSLQLPDGLADWTSGVSAFVVAKPTNNGAFTTLFDFGNPHKPSVDIWQKDSLFFSQGDGTQDLVYQVFKGTQEATQVRGANAILNDSFHLLGIVQEGGPALSSSAVSLYKDGTTVSTGETLVPAQVHRHRNYIGKAIEKDLFQGDIAEIIIYNTALPSTQRQAVEDYLTRKYNLSNRAPSTGLTWQTIATGLAAQSSYTDNNNGQGLASDANFWYRCQAMQNGTLVATGPARLVRTAPAAPIAPGAPTFGTTTEHSLQVIAPSLPANATHLTLQRQVGGTYVTVADNLSNGSTSLVSSLNAGTTYTFRYVAVGRGGSSAGNSASQATTSLGSPGAGSGWSAKYWNNTDFTGTSVTRTDATIDFDWQFGSPDASIAGDTFSSLWCGRIQPAYSQTYTFYADADNGVRVWVDGQLIIDSWLEIGGERTGTIALDNTRTYDVQVQHFETTGLAGAHLSWSSTSQAKEVIPASRVTPLPLPLLPAVPNVPTFTRIGVSTITVNPPTWPGNASFLELQMKPTRDVDQTFKTMATHIGPGQSTVITNLMSVNQYTFRYVAVGLGGTTTGADADVWTRPLSTNGPGAPTFVRVDSTTITIKAPLLPEGADSLTLQQSLANDDNYADVAAAAGVDGEALTTLTGLTANTVYYFRYKSIGRFGTAFGEGRAVETKSAPAAPLAAPSFNPIRDTSADTVAPTLPAGTERFQLEKKLATALDTSYTVVRYGYQGPYNILEPGQAVTADGLIPETAYSFRWVAIRNWLGDDGYPSRTPGPAATITTIAPAVPAKPFTPQFSSIGSSQVTVQVPALPARATGLKLQKKTSAETDYSYYPSNANPQVFTQAGSVVVTGLSSDTDYRFRWEATNSSGSTFGDAAGFSTITAVPDAPGAPTFQYLTSSSVEVIRPAAWPARARSLKLQIKEDGLYTSYSDVASVLQSDPPVLVGSLYRGKTYWFRYIAVGTGGESAAGTAASQVIPVPTSSWLAGTPIACDGIRPPRSTQVPAGGEVGLSSYLATDWDRRDVTFNGQTITTWRTDPCVYFWNVAAGNGSFKNGINRSQRVTWIAPTTPGTYTVTLVVVDQDQANIGTGETGTRDDASRGTWDAPLLFSITLTVVP